MKLLDFINKYTIKESNFIKKVCEPLHSLGISYLWYYFIEADGTFGSLSNDCEYVEYYVDSNMHLNVPYYSHPSYFRTGCLLTYPAFTNDEQERIKNSYSMDNILLFLKSQETRVEGFGFYNRNFNSQDLHTYLPSLPLFEKFICYFKREISHLIKKQKDFNIIEERGENFYKIDSSIPLVKNSLKEQSFLKMIYNLSPQEIRCLELFKQGYTAQASGSILNISNRTVEAHINNIKKKLKCHSKLELLNY